MEALHWYKMSSAISIGADSWSLALVVIHHLSHLPLSNHSQQDLVEVASGSERSSRHMLDSCYVEDVGRVTFYKVATNHFALGFYKMFCTLGY